jgi:hypothetical protein
MRLNSKSRNFLIKLPFSFWKFNLKSLFLCKFQDFPLQYSYYDKLLNQHFSSSSRCAGVTHISFAFSNKQYLLLSLTWEEVPFDVCNFVSQKKRKILLLFISDEKWEKRKKKSSFICHIHRRRRKKRERLAP